jgi:hypothetical protein
MNQHYFDVPFGFAGDVTPIPDPLQTGGGVSMTEGWNFNYQRDLSTDPAALPIDRSTMNWLLLQITQALQALQQTGTPEFINAAQNAGAAFPYGKGAEVLWSASGNAPFTKFVSLTAANTNTPSTSDPTGATTGWQIVCDPIATSAQAAAGTDNASIITPLLLAQQTALRALLAGNSSQVFNVAPATSSTQAVQLSQLGGYAGFLSLNANATLTNANANYLIDWFGASGGAVGLPSGITMPANSTQTIYNYGGGTLTLNTTGSGDFIYSGGGTTTHSIVLQKGDNLILSYRGTNEIDVIGGSAAFQFNPITVAPATAGTHAMQLQQATGRLLAVRVFTASGTYTPTAGTRFVIVKLQAAGGGGGGTVNTGANVSIGGGGGAGAYSEAQFISGFSGAAMVVGVGGTGGAAGGGSGTNGGNTSFAGNVVQGGGGGVGGAAATPPFAQIGGTGGPAPSFGYINTAGGSGGTSTAAAVASFVSGQGGNSALGAGGASQGTTTAPGNTAQGYGGGGGGAANGAGTSGQPGGNGAPGLIVVYEYA